MTASPGGALTDPPVLATDVLHALEDRLDPAAPEAAGLEVLGYGDVSVALVVPDLPDWVCKRISGLRDEAGAGYYMMLVRDYLARLAASGVRVTPTALVPVDRPGRPPVIYLLQRRLPAESLGHHVLVHGDDAAVARAVRAVLAVYLLLAGQAGSRVEVAVDGRLSNWSFATSAQGGPPELFDVGTPFMRRVDRGGCHSIDPEMFLSAIPPGARAYYRRRRAVQAYLDDYYDPRLVALDMLGTFHQEGRPDRIPLGVGLVNEWLTAHADVLGHRAPVLVDEVDRYYRHDASQFALFLRVRRADRLRTRALGGRYDFVLPGSVRR